MDAVMEHAYDYKKFAILYVDDEEKSLKYFARAFEEHFRILTAPNAQEGFALLQQHQDDLAMLITDQRMPGQTSRLDLMCLNKFQCLKRKKLVTTSAMRSLA